MESSQIVPDILDAAPKDTLEITYGDGIKVEPGNELKPTQVIHIPMLKWKADPHQLYTLIMTDPDEPSRDAPANREFRHWLVINIPGNTILNGQVLFEYKGASPSKDSGLHRYVFLVFQQERFIERSIYVDCKTFESRVSTSTRKLMQDFRLFYPLAGNFFVSQWEDTMDPPPSTPPPTPQT